ncbi:MAG: two-component regulator propeller domain-containing protein [Draconibacterium sp.]
MYKILVIILIQTVWLYSCKYSKTTSTPEANNWEKVSSEISYLNIQSFCQDSLGYIWIATLHGLNRYNGYEFHQYFYDEEDSTSLDNDMIFAIYIDSSHRLWIGTLTGVNLYDSEHNKFIRYSNSSGNNANVYSFHEDHSGNIWVATHEGLGLIDPTQQQVLFSFNSRGIVYSAWEDNFQRLWIGTDIGLAEYKNDSTWKYYPLPGNRQEITAIYKDPKGAWWLGTNAGLVCFDPISRTFQKLPSASLSHPDLVFSRISFIKEIDQLKLLIGTDSHGLFQYNIISQTIEQNNPWRLNELSSSELLCCYIDHQNNVWTGSYDKGFSVWNKSLEFFNANYGLSELVKNKFVTRIVEDHYNNLWIGTRYDGLYLYMPSGKVKVYNSENTSLLKDNKPIESLFIDSQNRIWIGLADQLIAGEISPTGEIKILKRKEIKQVRTMKEDATGNLWIGSWNGLLKVPRHEVLAEVSPSNLYHGNIPDLCVLDSGQVIFSSYGEGIFRLAKDDTIARIIRISGEAQSASQTCVTIFQDSQNRIWGGSYGHGVICIDHDQVHTLTKENGLANNNVLCFQEDPEGFLWMSTSSGISQLNPTNSTFLNYSSNDGTLGNQYHEKGGLKHTDGRIFFSGNHGLTFFNPMVVLPRKEPPVVVLEDLKILNRSIRPEPNSPTLTKNISYASNITLNHKQSNFSLDYTGFDFIAANKLNYAYKLEGFDERWNYMGGFRRASYSNLPAGNYTFRVKAINRDKVESIHPASIRIIVKPAPWFSWQAWALYFVAFISATYYLFRLAFKVKINRKLLAVEHNERLREQEIAEMKLNFFTNISHELRTPLTLISAPIEQLSTQKELKGPNKKLLDTVSRNVSNMLRLINQLLDFSKIENGILSLLVQKEDIIQHVWNIQDVFLYPAAKKKVEIIYTPHISSLILWVDTDKLEKILHNLLSNALKHTPENGSIKIITQVLSNFDVEKKYSGMINSSCKSYFEIEVTDSGPGIQETKLGELFKRYRRINGPSGLKPDYGGSGIGLHYTKYLVEKHYGQIKAQIPTNGGMTFSFILPIDDIYTEDQKQIPPESIAPALQSNEHFDKANIERKKQYTILIVEDNSELLEFIKNLLSTHYQTLEATNGDRGWELAQKESPDLILSDVLMPGLSGYQLCNQVKNHPELSHIPVILLTAKGTINDQVEGLEKGADQYICKPFNIDYLLLTKVSQLNKKVKLRQLG